MHNLFTVLHIFIGYFLYKTFKPCHSKNVYETVYSSTRHTDQHGNRSFKTGTRFRAIDTDLFRFIANVTVKKSSPSGVSGFLLIQNKIVFPLPRGICCVFLVNYDVGRTLCLESSDSSSFDRILTDLSFSFTFKFD